MNLYQAEPKRETNLRNQRARVPLSSFLAGLGLSLMLVSFTLLVACCATLTQPCWESYEVYMTNGQSAWYNDVVDEGVFTVGQFSNKYTFFGPTTPTLSQVSSNVFRVCVTNNGGTVSLHYQVCIGAGASPLVTQSTKGTNDVPTGPAVEATPATNGSNVKVSNPGQSTPMKLIKLQVALSPTTVPIGSLAYSNPAVEALPWSNIVTSPMNLAPGAFANYFVGLVPSSGNCYMRAQYTDVAGSLPADMVVLESPTPHAIPAVGMLALIFFAGSLLYLGALRLRRTELTPSR
jgi:hypothetical protein